MKPASGEIPWLFPGMPVIDRDFPRVPGYDREQYSRENEPYSLALYIPWLCQASFPVPDFAQTGQVVRAELKLLCINKIVR